MDRFKNSHNQSPSWRSRLRKTIHHQNPYHCCLFSNPNYPSHAPSHRRLSRSTCKRRCRRSTLHDPPPRPNESHQWTKMSALAVASASSCDFVRRVGWGVLLPTCFMVTWLSLSQPLSLFLPMVIIEDRLFALLHLIGSSFSFHIISLSRSDTNYTCIRSGRHFFGAGVHTCSSYTYPLRASSAAPRSLVFFCTMTCFCHILRIPYYCSSFFGHNA